MVANGDLDQPRDAGRRQPFLGLPLEFGVGDEDRQKPDGAAENVVAGHDGHPLVARHFAVGLEAAGKGVAQAVFVRSALGGGDGVAIGRERRLAVVGPCERPFRPAVAPVEVGFAGERHFGYRSAAVEHGLEIVGQAARKAQRRRFRNVASRKSRRAGPANPDALEQVRLGLRHAVEGLRPESRLVAEYFRVGSEADARAAPVARLAGLLRPAPRLSPVVTLRPEPPVASHFHFERLGQRVDDGQADPVQTAGGLVGFAVELSAGVQGRQNHFERRLVLELRVGIDRDSAAVVAHRHAAVGGEIEFDAVGMAGDRFVHGVCRGFRRRDDAWPARRCLRCTFRGVCARARDPSSTSMSLAEYWFVTELSNRSAMASVMWAKRFRSQPHHHVVFTITKPKYTIKMQWANRFFAIAQGESENGAVEGGGRRQALLARRRLAACFKDRGSRERVERNGWSPGRSALRWVAGSSKTSFGTTACRRRRSARTWPSALNRLEPARSARQTGAKRPTRRR